MPSPFTVCLRFLDAHILDHVLLAVTETLQLVLATHHAFAVKDGRDRTSHV